MGENKKKSTWAEAKKRCRLNQDDIQMAKELGMTPKSLLKNIHSPTQQWKAPVKVWINDLYEKKFGKLRTTEHTKPPLGHTAKREVYKESPSIKVSDISDEELPFYSG
jgi:hypothetical protein